MYFFSKTIYNQVTTNSDSDNTTNLLDTQILNHVKFVNRVLRRPIFGYHVCFSKKVPYII